jgi:hypothetical protein
MTSSANVDAKFYNSVPTRIISVITHRCLMFLLVFFLPGGCTKNDNEAKTSLFEEHHHEPAHWPDDLGDIAVKLRKRMSSEVSEKSLGEIKELVSWTAEVAADTNLAESDWVPVYEATESLSRQLRTDSKTLTTENRTQVEALCKLIDETVPKIAERMSDQQAE